ncbi:anti-sigma factor [Bacillus sp. M6-12]|uniref:anti-sigma factor n=1 Tax=Bacillus sp. M6-12 TaxID=2054166 RepID=UPI000C769A03|nr:anti-sigma factor [Bacillus sp. M6-12]PLS17438.1 anti-sigma factor [Bacillus sp. M6-12]
MADNFDNEEKDYKTFLNETKQDFKDNIGLSEGEQRRIIQTGRNTARTTNIMVSLAILLLIIPVMTILTYGFYSIGGRADKLIDVAAKTIYVTEPNMSLEEMEIEDEIGFFSMNILFDVYKRIGNEDYKMGDYDIRFALDEPDFPKKELLLEHPLSENPKPETERLFHPNASNFGFYSSEWTTLNKIPDGTVAEVYLSLSKLMSPKQVEDLMPSNVEVRWLAVDTGMEKKQVDSEGVPITPLGYPAQIDTTIWSPFNGREQSNEEVFVDILELLKENQEVSTTVARAKSLALEDRLAYVKKHGISIYGAVVTGPTPELRKLENMKEISIMRMGEVKLWNWE